MWGDKVKSAIFAKFVTFAIVVNLLRGHFDIMSRLFNCVILGFFQISANSSVSRKTICHFRYSMHFLTYQGRN